MQTIKKWATSRTVWTLVALFIVNGLTGIHDSLPQSFLPFIDGLLTILGIYFRANPKVA